MLTVMYLIAIISYTISAIVYYKDGYIYLLCDLANCLTFFLSFKLAAMKQINAIVVATSNNVVAPKRDPKMIVNIDTSPSPIPTELLLDATSV